MQTSVPLASFTTFHIGGPARNFIEVTSEEDIETALAYARESGLRLFVLGAGSNILVSDAGVDGLVMRMQMQGMTFIDGDEQCGIVGGAGMSWDAVVDAACARGLYGIENLAGIPGTLGGAAVQNIGAYGAELAPVFAYADVIDSSTSERRRINIQDAAFTYRGSIFKTRLELIIVRVALTLQKHGALSTSYADLAHAAASGTKLSNPSEVATAVRGIRALKFPSGTEEGTAGSFFKNPLIDAAHAADLATRFPGLPLFPQENGTVKIPLAWILDHVLSLKGYAQGHVRLYEKQPLVIVAEAGATASDVNALAHYVADRVKEATHIDIEREVETFGAR